MTNPPPALVLTRISAGYGGRPILHEMSLAVAIGESVALIGPNGCGKSTLFRVVAGTLEETRGEVALHGVPVDGQPTDARIRHGLGYLTQTRNIFAGLTVAENLLLAVESRLSGDTATRRVRRVLEVFPSLVGRRDDRAGLLSGGQRQVLAVAMVLTRPARLLLLDEPVAGLSAELAIELVEGLRTLQADDGFAMVLIEHRLRRVQPVVDRVLVMREGRIVDDTRETDRMLDAAWLAAHYTNGSRLP